MRLYLTNIFKNIIRNETNARHYARWAHRRPARVLTPEEFEEQLYPKTVSESNDHKIIELSSSEAVQQARNIKPIRTTYMNKKIEFDNVDTEQPKHFKTSMNKNIEFDNVDVPFDTEALDEETHHHGSKKKDKKIKNEVKNKEDIKYTSNNMSDVTIDDAGNFMYNKMKNNDPRIASLMLMVKSRKLRNKKSSILLEGKRLIKDALEVGCCLQHLLFSRKSDIEHIKDMLPENGVRLYKMAYRDIQMWSDLTTCPGIMGIFKIPDITNVVINDSSLPLTIICDNIREPGNLGAIIRASAAVGCRNIILTKGCVDLWEPKVLRSASGAHFRLPIHKNLEWHMIHEHLDENTSVVLADNTILTAKDKNSSKNIQEIVNGVPILPYYGLNFSDFHSITLVVGGETLGLSEEAYKLATQRKGVRLNIPLDNNVESLNTGTALGVIAFEMKRQFLKHKTN